jgi:hypothetical protein
VTTSTRIAAPAYPAGGAASLPTAAERYEIVTRRALNCHAPVWSRHTPPGSIEGVNWSPTGGPSMYVAIANNTRVRNAQAALTRAGRRLAAQVGQGTVEYVALILLVALVMAGVVAAMKGYKTSGGKDLGDAIIGKIKDAVGKVQF